jgi:hypothetical protein
MIVALLVTVILIAVSGWHCDRPCKLAAAEVPQSMNCEVQSFYFLL